MALVQIWEQFRGRGATAQNTGISYDRVFKVEMSTGADGPHEVGVAMNGLGFILGVAHPDNAFALLNKIDPKNDKAPRWWKVTIGYSTLARDQKHTSDPDLDPLQISVDEEKFTRPSLYDRDGEAILSSSGTRPDPPVMVEDTNRILTIKGSSAGTGFPAWENGYRNRINSDAFKIAGTDRTVQAKKAKVRSIKLGDVEYRGGSIALRPFTLQLEVLDTDDPTWEDLTNYLDASYYRRATAAEISEGTYTADDLVEILINGKQPKEPQLLDGSGQPLVDPTPSNAVFRESKTLRLGVFIGNLPGCIATS